MNVNRYAEAIVEKERKLKHLMEHHVQPLKEEIKGLRNHMLNHLRNEGIKTLDTSAAQLQVRSRKVNFVEERELDNFIHATLGEWSDEVDHIWPAVYDKAAALAFARDHAPELIKSNTSHSLVVNPVGDK